MDDEVEIILQQDSVEVTEPLVADYILPTATASTLGGVKIGDNVSIASDGTISVPTASADTKGVIRIGSGLSIDANGIVSVTGTYTLPQATKTTLGGVYVDDELSTASYNPVQNSVVATALNQTNGNVSNLSTTVGNLSTTVGNLSNSVGTLTNSVNTLSGDVSDLSTTSDGLVSSVSSLSSRIGDAEGDITSLDNVTTLLLTNTYEAYDYEDIDDSVWSAGVIELVGYGMNGYINIDLEGSLTIASSSSETIFTLPSILPEYDVNGVAITDGGVLKIEITSGGNIVLTNMSTSSISLTKLSANVSIVIASDNP